jgi:hypothetical protein
MHVHKVPIIEDSLVVQCTAIQPFSFFHARVWSSVKNLQQVDSVWGSKKVCFFPQTLASRLASTKQISLTKSEINTGLGEEESVRGKKHSTGDECVLNFTR